MSRRIQLKFRLYVAGDALNSVQALANLTALCKAYLPDQHEIEVVDVLKDPQRALADEIFMTPTLVKLAPSPTRRIVGTLSHKQKLMQALDMESIAV